MNRFVRFLVRVWTYPEWCIRFALTPVGFGLTITTALLGWYSSKVFRLFGL